MSGLERYLHSYALFATQRGDEFIVAQTAIDWAGQADSPEQAHLRLQKVIQFARYCRAEDSRHEIPLKGVCPRRHRRPTPYIYSVEELRDLILQASFLGPPGSLRPHTYSTLLSLLSMTGLRVSEAIALRLADYRSEGLHIRESKFRKSRIVPLHATGHAALQRYIGKRAVFASSDEDHIFLSGRQQALRGSVVRRTFRNLLTEAGIGSTRATKPRLMDLRHTYATTVLLSGPSTRDHACRHMLALSTAMGHSSMAATFWYLERTPALMNDIAQACQENCARKPS
ncbi:MAG: tyrosine-type recombinase/integrase [Sedimenticolaceae bacterium]